MRLIKWLAIGFGVLVIGILAAIYFVLRGSLPQLDGKIALAAVKAPVTIERDVNGIVTVTAANRTDLAFATGYAHGQDRLFQMDLLRRVAAGELAELLGKDFVPMDKRFRRHAFRQVAAQVVAQATPEQKQVLEAYVAGVNAAHSAMRTQPFEYLLLQTEPAQWRVEDCILAAFAMYIDLNDSDGAHELERARLHSTLPQAVFDLLYPQGTEWDAPIDHADLSTLRAAIPGEEVVDLRKQPIKKSSVDATSNRSGSEHADYPGSNNWVLAGSRTATGAGLVANDMHLTLRLPHIWYRARLIVKSADAALARDLIGVTLPGLPVLVAGSNTFIAWGFTNTHGDLDDLVLLDSDATHPNQYRNGNDFVDYVIRKEHLKVRGGTPVEIEYRDTIWGPVIDEKLNDQSLALAWTAHHAEATNLRHLQLEAATSAEQAIGIANTMGIPLQNFVVADRGGHIGWTVVGQMPKRQAINTRLPFCWGCAPSAGWDEFLPAEKFPRSIDPASGQLWSANSRTLGYTGSELIGDEDMDRGARAKQIRDDLTPLQKASTRDMLNIQLDDRAVFLKRWHDALIRLLDDAYIKRYPARRVARALVERWSDHAAIDDAGYRIVRAFRGAVQADIYRSLIAPAIAKYPQTEFKPSARFEDSLWQIITTQPPHMLPPEFSSWDEYMLASLDRALEELKQQCGGGDSLAKCTWGKRNTLLMAHPLASALPFGASLLSVPSDELPGDNDMPRVQGKSFGASERFAVSPGHESEGYFNMPGGASGHPLSPFFTAGHKDWVKAEPTPFLPGDPRFSLELVPAQ